MKFFTFFLPGGDWPRLLAIGLTKIHLFSFIVSHFPEDSETLQLPQKRNSPETVQKKSEKNPASVAEKSLKNIYTFFLSSFSNHKILDCFHF